MHQVARARDEEPQSKAIGASATQAMAAAMVHAAAACEACGTRRAARTLVHATKVVGLARVLGLLARLDLEKLAHKEGGKGKLPQTHTIGTEPHVVAHAIAAHARHTRQHGDGGTVAKRG